MESLDSDKEQLEKIRQWLRENGMSIITGIALGLGGVYGWRYWQDYRVSKAEEASAILADAALMASDRKYEGALESAKKLADERKGTLAGDMALLQISAINIELGKLQDAATLLKQVADNGADQGLRHLARTRLIRLYIDLGKLDMAASLLPDSEPAAWARTYTELRGDIAYARGDIDAARTAYNRALAMAGSTDSTGDDTAFLKMKIDDMPAAR